MATRGSGSVGNPAVLRATPRNARIAVVGGGASGLSAAYLLKKAGYSHVTVFEKESRLGGKCRTVMIYAIAREEIAGEEIHGKIVESIRQFRGKLGHVVCSQSLSYFPCVSRSDLKAGFYRRLEGRQGLRNTYYAGEIMHFPCVDSSAAYSAHLVRKHFA
ncbi:MAG: FAD-dependent oxidoreductase [Terriglobia bacterium]|jgi:hypothetical protein